MIDSPGGTRDGNGACPDRSVENLVDDGLNIEDVDHAVTIGIAFAGKQLRKHLENEVYGKLDVNDIDRTITIGIPWI